MTTSEDQTQAAEPEVADLIAHYGLARLPVEGTLYRSTWVAAGHTPTGDPQGTAIIGLYCQQPLSRSLFHQLAYDEVWHFYAGDPFRLVLLHPGGRVETVVMGVDWRSGQRVQFVIPAGVWQAGELLPGGRYALFGCTMAPGFSGGIFEAGRRQALLADHPEQAEFIRRLSPPDAEAHLPEGFTQ